MYLLLAGSHTTPHRTAPHCTAPHCTLWMAVTRSTPEAVEEGAGAARVAGRMKVEESGLFVYDDVHQTFCFSLSSEKRGRKLSGEDQQEEAKRPKSPEKGDFPGM